MNFYTKSLYIFFTIIFSINILYSQHPDRYLNDIYDLEWCLQKNIKSIESGGDQYILKNGIIIGENAANILVRNDGKIIECTYGHGSFKVITHLTSDLKRIKERSLGPNLMCYHYDENNRLSHIIGTNSTAVSSGPTLTEMGRDSEGSLISKDLFLYKDSTQKTRYEWEQLQSIERKLIEHWDYQYNENGKVDVITIIRYELDSDQIEWTYMLKFKHENDLPITLKVGLLEGGYFVPKKTKHYKYTL